MPTAYKGKLRITCKPDVCIQDPLRANATEECFTCPEAACEILDLDDRVILAIGQLNDPAGTVPLPGAILLRDGPETGEPETAAAKKGKKKR